LDSIAIAHRNGSDLFQTIEPQRRPHPRFAVTRPAAHPAAAPHVTTDNNNADDDDADDADGGSAG